MKRIALISILAAGLLFATASFGIYRQGKAVHAANCTSSSLYTNKQMSLQLAVNSVNTMAIHGNIKQYFGTVDYFTAINNAAARFYETLGPDC